MLNQAQAPGLPLAGIRVLEFTHAVMGPSAGLILADLGAEVIHIEPPKGDSTRRLKGMGSGYFSFFNRNKKSLAVDIKHAEGRRILEALIPTADVIVENFGPGTMDRLGYGYEACRDLKPNLVYCALKGFLSGPYESRTAMDEVVQMMGGLAYMTGPPGKPLRAGSSVIDIGGGMFGVLGILSALFDRERTGQGRYIKSALFETTAFFMGQHMAYAAVTEDPVPPMPARVSAWAIYRVFETKGGTPLCLGIISDKHWVRFCEEFGRTQWLEDPRLATNNLRIDAGSWLLPEVEAMMADLPVEHVMASCERAGIPFAPIARPEDLFSDPQLNKSEGGLLATTLPDGVETRLPRLPIEMGGADLGLRANPPQVGEHTTGILQEVGYDDEAIAALRKSETVA